MSLLNASFEFPFSRGVGNLPETIGVENIM